MLDLIAPVIRDYKSHKIIEVAHKLNVPIDYLMPYLETLDKLGIIVMGGYVPNDPPKFIRMTIPIYQRKEEVI